MRTCICRSRAADRKRSREADFPDTVGYRSKWRNVFDQVLRLYQAGYRFDGLTLVEDDASKVPILQRLTLTPTNPKFVGEVAENFAVEILGCPEPRRDARR